MTEAIIVALIVQFGLILVAVINSMTNGTKMDKANSKIDNVEKQFVNNGGSTAKDQLDRIEQTLLNHETTMAGLTSTDIADRAAAVLAHDGIFRAIRDVESAMKHNLKEMLHSMHKETHDQEPDLPEQ